MTDRQQRVAIVTGASKSIGATVAKRLGREGFAVVVNYARGRADATSVVDDIVRDGGRAIAVEADVAAPSAAPTLFDAAEKSFGGTDVLVNNAGIMRLAPIAEATDEDMDQQIALNVVGAMRGMREAARRLRDGGRIINMSTCVVGLYQPTYSVYAATKSAVEAMTHIVAKELGARGITVNAIAPGPVETPFFTDGKTDEQIRAAAAANPMKRLGRPDDVADVAAFLASPQGGWINGQVIRANGGVI